MVTTLTLVWLVYAGLAAALSAPVIFFGRKRVHWHWWELSAFLLPFVAWSLLMFSELATGRKSLANLAEPFYFSLAVPVAAGARVLAGDRVAERICAASLIALLCGVAAVMFFLIPSWPE